jgi:hypothetical protein
VTGGEIEMLKRRFARYKADGWPDPPWKVTNLDYCRVEIAEPATWFIDAPYQACDPNLTLNYAVFADWVRSRKEQVIVTKMDGTDWLSIRELRPLCGWDGRIHRQLECTAEQL